MRTAPDRQPGGQGPTGASRANGRSWLGERARLLIVPVLFLLLWDLIASRQADRTVLPRPADVAVFLYNALGEAKTWAHLAASLRRVALGYAVALLLGLSAGVVMGFSALVDDLLDPTIQMLRPIPGLAILPLLLVLIGLGDKLIVSIVAYAAFFPIAINTAAAIRGVDRIHRDAALTLGAGRWLTLTDVILPAALPRILVGMRIGLTFAWMSIIGAEFVGTLRGLGYMITWYQRLFIVEGVVMSMIIIGLLGFSLDRILLSGGRRLVPWQGGLTLRGD